MQSELGELAGDWNELARRSGSMFNTHEWLSCWWRAFGQGDPRWTLLQDRDGSLRAGAFLSARSGQLISPANIHSGAWGALARDEPTLAELWAEVARGGPARMKLTGLLERGAGARTALQELARAGYSTVAVAGVQSPWRDLPESWEEIIASISASLRSQVRRRRKMLEREGALTFRVVTGGPTLGDDLEAFLELEASGWKGRRGTAIVNQPQTERLYREFAHIAADRGWLRLYLLELEGRVIAADYGCAYAGAGMLMKTAFDEAYRRLSPGLVLRAEVLRACIEEGLSGYDFLGQPARYKLSWASEIRPRTTILAYRGPARARYLYRITLREWMKSGRDRGLAVRSRLLGR